MTRSRAWLCWSSGKDSAWALHVSRERGEHDIVGLLTTVTEAYDRVSMHGVRSDILEAQAQAAGLPLCRVIIPATCTNEIYEQAMQQAIEEAKNQGVSEMLFGDLFLEDVRAYRERQLAGTGIEARFPLWEQPTDRLAHDMIAAGLVSHITTLDPKRIPRELAGRRFDKDLLSKLPADVDPCGENGEFHTCVSAGPMFASPISVAPGIVTERDGFVYADLMLADAAREDGVME